MIIRRYLEQDQNEVIGLWKACGLVFPQNNPKKDIERKLEVDPDLFLVGNHNGNIVASVMGGYEGHRGWVNYLAVDMNYRKKGFGKQIMLDLERRLIKKGCPKINIQIRGLNLQVIQFYKSIGFLDDNVIGYGKRLEQD